MEVTDNSGSSSSDEQLHVDWFGFGKANKPATSTDLSELYYSMVPLTGPSTKRGRCLILNYEEFEIMKNGGLRKGSQKDVDSLKKTFESFGYEVMVHKNLTKRGTEFVLNSEIQSDHTKNDSFILCILTHGKEGDVLCCSDGEISPDYIITKLTAPNCPTLAGKPKLLFIQACRGEMHDSGFELQVDGPVQSKPNTESSLTRIPTHADFFVFRSTYAGYFSWRNSAKGSWFIQDLCNVLDRFGDQLDLMMLMTMVCREVALNRESKIPVDEKDDEEKRMRSKEMSGKKEMPVMVSTLTRMVTFAKVK